MLPAIPEKNVFLSRELSGQRIRWNWIIHWRADLVWYVGSALAGWLYVILVLNLGRGLKDPLHDPFYTLTLGSHSFSLTLYLAVFISWAFLVDSPHLWATLARTYLDPDEWSRRRRELLFALVLFGIGPIAVLGPYLLGIVGPLSDRAMARGEELFFAFFRLWAYQHVVRQHWGFLMLYKRRNSDLQDPIENRADFWFFNLSLYLPLLMFVSAPWYYETGFPQLDTGLIGTHVITQTVHSICFILYLAIVVGYVHFQIRRWANGVTRNGPKLLFLLSIVPLHFVVFAQPLLGYFVAPIVTVGHNLQYHRIVWMYGRNKYAGDGTGQYWLVKPIFRQLWLYLLLGGVFTFGFHRGPWINFLEETLGFYFDRWIFPAIGLMAGLTDPATVGVGAQVIGLLFTGWSMHHYYLDGKIWHVNRDSAVARSLNV